MSQDIKMSQSVCNIIEALKLRLFLADVQAIPLLQWIMWQELELPLNQPLAMTLGARQPAAACLAQHYRVVEQCNPLAGLSGYTQPTMRLR